MGQKDFIDTAIVPLISIDLASEKMKQSGAEVDFLMSLTSFIEQQFKGRLLVMPPFFLYGFFKKRRITEAI
ncbi:YpiF family protein [Lysinibacillus sp. MHQ-1]|nr:YpiF family protein [Lysinibacillus sp. MHQ-1]